MTDPTVLALAEYFASTEGQLAQDMSILRSPEVQRYLRNRLEGAFLAGVRSVPVPQNTYKEAES